MNRFATGLIAGGIAVAIGIGFVLSDKETKAKISETGRKAVRKAEEAMDEFAENYLK